MAFQKLPEQEFKDMSGTVAILVADFHKDANTLKNLRHPNIAMLVGSSLDKISVEFYLVLEWL